MSPSPAGTEDAGAIASYAASWGKLMAAVRGGSSWSGSERNRCFLNTGGRFANASYLSGLDFDDDGRALAVCDWDRDGDLDLWLRNRTAPRLRLMENRHAGGRSVALRLQGTECNRDAIGAVVELRGDGAPLLRSVRAGEMFLSQSSKWLHFGLAGDGVVEEVVVRWPGGGEEMFAGVTAGGRFLLRQGEGVARKAGGPVAVRLPSGDDWPQFTEGPSSRISLPVAVPVPGIVYRDQAAKPARLAAGGGPLLLLLWESSCEVCARELAALEAARARLQAAGIRCLALAVDGIETAGAAYERIDASGFSSPWGFIDPASLEALLRWQAAMFDRRPPAAVPLGLLLDRGGHCLAIYRGEIGPGPVIEDAERLIGIDPMTRWHLAPPLAGTWFTNPVDPSFVRRLLE